MRKPKTKLEGAAVTIGTAVGKADRAAHKVASAALVAREELQALSQQIDSLKRQLAKSNQRIKRAFQ